MPLIIIVLFVNIYVDSGLLFRKKEENTKLAALIVAGNNVGIKIIPNEWAALQLAFVEEEKKQGQTTPKDIVAFGTSRSSEINSGLFPSKTFFNCVVPGGTINDIIALYGLYKMNNLLPKYLIINIDFCTFHLLKEIQVNKDVEFIADSTATIPVGKDLYKYYLAGLKYIDAPLPEKRESKITANDSVPDYLKIFTNFAELLNPDYFKTNLNSWRKLRITKNEFLHSYFVIRKDGGYSLSQQSNIDSVFVLEGSKQFVSNSKGHFFVAHDVKTIYFDYFRKLVLSLKKDGVIPIVYISPVNPYVYDHISNSKNVLMEQYIDSFCVQNKVLRIGSFNPHVYGYHSIGNYFIDAYHPVKSVVEDIFHHHRTELKTIGIDISNDIQKSKIQ